MFVLPLLVMGMLGGIGVDRASATPVPVAAYSFDEGSGEMARDSAGNHDGRIHGAGWAEGKYGSALEFDGEDDIVTVPASEALDFAEGFTLEAWVRPSEAHSWASLIAKEDGGESPPFSYLLYGQGGGEAPVVYMAGGESELTHNDGETGLPLSAWSHLAVTSDGEHSRIYIDGELDSVGPALPVKPTNGPLQIGGNEVFGEHFAGRVDDVRLYDEPLGAEEIEEDEETPVEPGSYPEPAAAYSFDEAEGETAHDEVGGHDGAIHGAGWAEGKYGSALEFDGEDDIVTVPASEGLDFTEGFTLEAWVDPSEAHSWASLIAKEDSTEALPFSYLLYGQGGGEAPVIYMAENEASFTHNDGETGLPLNTWSQLAVTSDGEHSRIYINGSLDSVGPALPVKATSGAVQIGGNEIFGEHFAGRIDEVHLYGEVLGNGEIEEDRETPLEASPSEEPVAAYTFDEGEGAVAHDAFEAHDATVEGAKWAEGKYGSTLEFDGENDCVTIPAATDLELRDEFTLEAWVNPQSSQEEAPIFFKEAEGGAYGYSLYAGATGSGKAEGFVADESEAVSTANASEALPANTWSHVALTSDGETLSLYVNGTLADSSSAGLARRSAGPLEIGCNQAGEAFFEGRIDEVRLYSRALEEAEIKRDKNSDYTPPEVVLSGGLTEGVSEGTESYPLKVVATDGEAGKPQAGVKRIQIDVDGEFVKSVKETCSEGNCSLNLEWTYKTSTYSPEEPHEVSIFVEDQGGEVEYKVIALPVPDGDVPACKPLGGETVSTPSETESLPGGGVLETYNGDDGVAYSFPRPPEGFEPVMASAEELSEYGFPPRPTGPKALETWEANMEAVKTVEPSGVCTEITESNLKNAPNWSGFIATGPPHTDNWAAVNGEYLQVKGHKKPSCPGGTEASWVGLGGLNNPDRLIQIGTRIEYNGHLGAFFNALIKKKVEQADFQIKNFPVSRGDEIAVTAAYEAYAERINLSIENKTTGQFLPVRPEEEKLLEGTPPSEFYDGSTAEFIDEREYNVVTEELSGLTNFGTVHWTGLRVAPPLGDAQTIGEVPHGRTKMRPTGGPTLAAPEVLRKDGESFADHWLHCEPDVPS
jgi:hypothetical protein